MKFTVIVDDDVEFAVVPHDDAGIWRTRRTFDAGETLDALDEALEAVRDFLEAADADPQAALDEEEGDNEP